jgi:biopolymer transport protein ExbD
MRLTSHKVVRGPLDLPMTSMIDVVFLLLIFFMTTTSVVKTERELDSGIQVQKQSTSKKVSDWEPAIVDVVPAGGTFVFRVGGREVVTPDELIEVLRPFPNKGDGAFVRVHDDVPFDLPAAAIQACKTAGFTAVSYVPYSANR